MYEAFCFASTLNILLAISALISYSRCATSALYVSKHLAGNTGLWSLQEQCLNEYDEQKDHDSFAACVHWMLTKPNILFVTKSQD